MWNPQHNAWLLTFRYGIRMRIFLRLQERKMTMLWVLGILLPKNCKFQGFFFNFRAAMRWAVGKRIILYLIESVLVLFQCGGVQLFPKTVFTSSFARKYLNQITVVTTNRKWNFKVHFKCRCRYNNRSFSCGNKRRLTTGSPGKSTTCPALP